MAHLVQRLDDNQREDFEERAAIIEFDANVPRAHAECLALLHVLRRSPAALTGVCALRIEVQGIARCLLTTNLAVARAELERVGGRELGIRNPATLVSEEFGGVAQLTKFD